MPTFGEWLKETRKRRGLTLEDLAAKADTTHPSISRLEGNRANPSRKMVLRLAEALEVDADPGLLAAGFTPQEEIGAITYVTDPEEAVLIESYRGLNSQISKSLAQRMMKQLREAEKETAIGGRRADEGDAEQVGDGDPAGDAAA